MHYRHQDPLLLTGIADFVQVLMRYTVEPRSKLIVFNFKVINITKFLLENLLVELEVSPNVQVKPFSAESNVFKIKQISTREHVNWSVAAKLTSFSDCIC